MRRNSELMEDWRTIGDLKAERDNLALMACCAHEKGASRIPMLVRPAPVSAK